MRTNRNNIIKILAAGIAMASAFVAANPVFAANTYTPVQGTTVQFEKYLIYDSNALPPQVTFEFTLDPANNEIAPNAGENKLAVYSGDDNSILVIDDTKAAVSVGSASFNYETTKYDSVQAIDSSVNFGKHETLTNDPVDLTKDSSGHELPSGKAQSYSRVPVTIDFTNVNFTEPGVYRWKITENDNATAAGIGVTKDSADHFIDVYVDAGTFTPSNTAGAGNATLSIVGYVFHTDATFQPTTLSVAQEPANAKAKGFTNYYETHDVTISKKVAGNQAAHDKYFKFTVSFDLAGAENKITAVGSFDRTTADNAANTRTKEEYKGQTQPEYIVTDESGSVTQVYYLEHNQDITLQGIPKNSLVTIIEDPEDYKVTLQVDGNFIDSNEPFIGTDNTIVMYSSVGDAFFEFTNTKAGTIPTGVITSVLPGVAIAVIGIAGFVLAKKRNADNV